MLFSSPLESQNFFEMRPSFMKKAYARPHCQQDQPNQTDPNQTNAITNHLDRKTAQQNETNNNRQCTCPLQCEEAQSFLP